MKLKIWKLKNNENVVITKENAQFKGCEFESGATCFSPKQSTYDPEEFVKFINSFDYTSIKKPQLSMCDNCLYKSLAQH